MPTDEPGRFLVAVGVENYESSRWKRLAEVPKELSLVTGLLTGARFAVRHELESESALPSRESILAALRAWATAPERRRDDHFILYWSGHAEVHADELYLVLPKTTAVEVDGLRLVDVINVLLGPSSICGPVLLLLDVCYAGQGAFGVDKRLDALARARPSGWPLQVSILAATRPRDPATVLIFADAFKKAIEAAVEDLRHRRDRLSPALGLTDIARRIDHELKGSGQRPYLFIQAEPDALQFFRNPQRARHWPSTIDRTTQESFEKLEPAARGVSRPEDPGWYFEGRKHALEQICRWLEAGPQPGLCRVTGRVGAGKSAVLGHLYTLNRADYRGLVPDDVLATTILPPLGSIDCAIDLSKKTLLESLEAIGQGLGIVANSEDLLKDAINKRGTCPTVLADGLDESDAWESVAALLQALALTSARIVVGARPLPFAWTVPQVVNVDLDVEPWRDLSSVETYVFRRLAAESPGISPQRAWQQDLRATSHAVATRADGNFLVASLCATALLMGSDENPSSASWRFPKNLGEAFTRIFDRMGNHERDVRRVLLPLAYAEGNGLPAGPLWALLASRIRGRATLRLGPIDVVERVPWFFADGLSSGHRMHRLFHSSLREYLQQDHQAARIHGRIAATLVKTLALGTPDPWEGVADQVYARNYLSRHLRRAGFWRSLGKLTVDPSWIEGQGGNRSLKTARYGADVEEARTAATAANLAAAQAERPLPALAMEAWWLLWRSALVSMAARIPAEGWALLVRRGVVTPEDALNAVLLIGEEQVRAARLEALSRVVDGHVLDDLLNYAEGIKVAGDGIREADGLGAAGRQAGQPLSRYPSVLVAALRSSNGKRLAGRALQAAQAMEGHGRWIAIAAALAHLDERQMTVARDLINEIRPSIVQPWRSLGLAAHAVERMRRGDASVREEIDGLGEDDLTRWHATAELLGCQRARHHAPSTSAQVLQALATLDQHVHDWVASIEVATKLICALPAIDTPEHRNALAGYLRRLRAVSHAPDLEIEMAAQAGNDLPHPHGARLLRWATWRLLGADYSRRPQINFYFTPGILAVALARQGRLQKALDVADMTTPDAYLKPKAFFDVVCAAAGTVSSNVATATISAHIENRQLSAEEQFELRCASYSLLCETAQGEVLAMLGREGVKLGEVTGRARCDVMCSLALRANRDDMGALCSRFIQAAKKWAPGNDDLLGRFASNCARAGHVEAAAAVITLTDPAWRKFVWRQVLDEASQDAVDAMLMHLVGDGSQFEDLADSLYWPSLTDAIARASREVLRVLVDHRHPEATGIPETLNATIAARAFELQDHATFDQLLPTFADPLPLLRAVRRFQREPRQAFIGRFESLLESSTTPPLARAVADLLRAGEVQEMLASSRLADVLMNESDWVAANWVECLVADDQRRLAAALFDKGVSERPYYLNLEDRDDSFDWQLPLLDASRVERLVHAALDQHNDHDHDRIIVKLLPTYAALHESAVAMSLRDRIQRSDFRAVSWAAIFERLTAEQRERAFQAMVPDRFWDDDRGALALGKIAQWLDEKELVRALRWVAKNHHKGCASHLKPFVEAACKRDRAVAYGVWRAVLVEASAHDAEVSAEYLGSLAELAAHLGGKQALLDLDRVLERASVQWP